MGNELTRPRTPIPVNSHPAFQPFCSSVGALHCVVRVQWWALLEDVSVYNSNVNSVRLKCVALYATLTKVFQESSRLYAALHCVVRVQWWALLEDLSVYISNVNAVRLKCVALYITVTTVCLHSHP